MHRAIRTQADGKGDQVSDRSQLLCEDPSVTRQEFADEADVNKLLGRFGVNPPQREVQWGRELDYTIDLHTAMVATDAAKQAHQDLPPELKKRYATWRELMGALDRGELKINMDTAPRVTPDPAQSTLPLTDPPPTNA